MRGNVESVLVCELHVVVETQSVRELHELHVEHVLLAELLGELRDVQLADDELHGVQVDGELHGVQVDDELHGVLTVDDEQEW